MGMGAADGMLLLLLLLMDLHLLAEDLATIPTLGLEFNVTAANRRLSHRCAIVRSWIWTLCVQVKCLSARRKL
jgi:hypothetical protein